MTASQLAHATTLREEGAALGLPLLAVILAVTCAGAESSLRNVENGGRSTLVNASGPRKGLQITNEERAVARRSLGLGDYLPTSDNLDSMGLFAQRPSQGWGTPEQLMNPRYAARKFYEALVRRAGWVELDPAVTLSQVQGYPHPEVYQEWLPTARSVVKT